MIYTKTQVVLKQKRILVAVLATLPLLANAEESETINLENVNVTAPSIKAYSSVGSSATKTDAPLIDTPISVHVVPSEIIKEQRLFRVQDALENVSGLRGNNNDNAAYIYKIRGFTSQNNFRNNLSLGSANSGIQDTANIERIEVLKGPSSILFGRVDPGGLINVVTKKPEKESLVSVTQDVGMYDFYRTSVDATGSVTESGNMTYRFDGVYQKAELYRDFQGNERFFAAPSINIDFSENTHLLLEAEYFKSYSQSDTGIPAVGNRPADVPLKRSFQEANDPKDLTENKRLAYEFNHTFDNGLQITNRALYAKGKLDSLSLVAQTLDEVTGNMDRQTQYQTLDGDTFTTNLDLKGNFDLMQAKHQWLVGVDYLRSSYEYFYGDSPNLFPINIYNPVYGGVTKADYESAKLGNGLNGYDGFSNSVINQTGFYLQDQISWNDKWHLLLGARYDDATLERGASSTSASEARRARRNNKERNDTEWSPRAGLLYKINPLLSVYGSFAQSFGQNNVDPTGKAYDPEQGKQFEVGVKAEIAKELFATVALYHLTKENILQPNTATADPNDRILSGEARSRGVEVDVMGKVTDRLSMNVAYAYTDTEVTKDVNGLQGLQLDNVPKNTARLFMTYDWTNGGLGWKAGAGFYAAGKAYVNPANDAKIPGFVRLDANASYTGKAWDKRWTAQLNVRNLLNKDYFDGSDIYYNYIGDSRLYLFAGAPLTANATLGMEF